MNKQRQIFEFGQFRLDVERSRLTTDGELVSLPPKAVSLLTILLKHQGRAVEKEELMQTIWPDMIVEDSNLTQTVHILRKSLGKFPDSNIMIETLPRFGYRLIADVSVIYPDQEKSLAQASQPANFHPYVGEEAFSVGLTGKGFFYSLQKHLFLWLQKRLVKVSVKEASPSN